MKRLVIRWLVLGVLVISCLQALAVPPSLPQLKNRAAYITWACRNVAGGSAYVSGYFVESTNTRPYVDVATNVTDPRVVLDLLASQVASFKPLHPETDTVSSVMILRDANWHTLFYGVTSFQMVLDQDGQWTIPVGAGAVSVNNLSYWQYVYVGEDVYGGQLAIRDQNGNVIGYEWFNVYDGWMEFPVDRFGAGDLILYQGNGDSVAYDLQNGGQQIDTDIQHLNIHGDMSELVDYRSETVSSIVVTPFSQDGYGSVRPIQITATAHRFIRFSGLTTEGERAIQAVVVNMVTGQTEVKDVTGIGFAWVHLAPGTYQIYMIWEDGFDEFQPEDYYGGGKG